MNDVALIFERHVLDVLNQIQIPGAYKLSTRRATPIACFHGNKKESLEIQVSQLTCVTMCALDSTHNSTNKLDEYRTHTMR